MIISFSVSNFLSIKEEQTLSFEATTESKYDEYFIREAGKYKLLKMGILYGANASGKTNILKALYILRQLVSKSRDADQELDHTPFLFDPDYENDNCKMKLVFLIKEKDKYIKHIYAIEFNSKEIVYESLKFYPGQQPALIYERRKDEELERGYSLAFGKDSKPKSEEQNILESNTLRNNTILSALNKVNLIIPNVRRVKRWFDDYISALFLPYSADQERDSDLFFHKSENRKRVLSEFLRKADYNVTEFIFSDQKWQISLGKDYNAQMRNRLAHQTEIEIMEILSQYNENLNQFKKGLVHNYTVNGKEEERELSYTSESNGTKRSFELAAPLIDSLVSGKLVIIDEIESSLHFDLVKYIILVFLANSEDSQMLFTTHNLLLLDWEILRHDVIWFTEKKEDGSTELYSLADFNELNRSNILKRYLSGQFGAKPDIYDYKLDLRAMKEESDGKKD